MGISWIFEIVSWYVDGFGYKWYWNIIDVFNILRKHILQKYQIKVNVASTADAQTQAQISTLNSVKWKIASVFLISSGAVAMFVIYVCKNDVVIKQLEDSYPTLQRNKKLFTSQ